ncbi:MAG: hypothetical protein EA401_01265 [Planctomycetota bacterium]|nr:MAG: hypothetical protein EA401_01265 [Planctomycetota bacterium]
MNTLQEKIAATMNFLAQEGYRPEQVHEEVVVFKHEGHSFLIDYDEDDQQYARIVLPNFKPIHNQAERTFALQAANNTNQSIKNCLITVGDTQASGMVEFLIQDVDCLLPLLDRTVSALDSAARFFLRHIQELTDEAKAFARSMEGAEATDNTDSSTHTS